MNTPLPPPTPTPLHPQGTNHTEVRGSVLLIGINRPNKRNGFTPKMYRELGLAYTQLDDDPALRVGVLHAFGEHFTAGLGLPTIAPLMQRGEKAVPLGLVDPVDLGMPGYRRRTKPIVVASDNCRFSQLEVKRGIMATGGATLRMAERAGLGNALLHLLTGDEFGAAEALRLNFVQKVVPAGQALPTALALAEVIAEQAPLAVVATRQNVLKAIEHGPLVAMHDFIDTQQRLSRSDDAREGVQSFIDKRPAHFTGR